LEKISPKNYKKLTKYCQSVHPKQYVRWTKTVSKKNMATYYSSNIRSVAVLHRG